MRIFVVIILTLHAVLVSNAQELSRGEIAFLNRNAIQVNLNENFKDGNWSGLKEGVGNKQIVLLGEFNHETHEVFKIKNDLIQYLHEELGFNTILFEAGIGELIIPDQQKNELTPAQMTYGFFGYWRTQEFIDLMNYVQDKKINIAGFDVQRFGSSFSLVLNKAAKTVGVESTLYSSIEDNFDHVQDFITDRNAVYDSVKTKTNQLIDDYENLLNAFNGSDAKWVIQTVKNRIHYLKFRLQFLNDRDWNQRWLARDSMMAENVFWLLDNVYKDEKVIIYAHNFHIAKFNEKEEVMGEYLNRAFAKDMYSVGFFAGEGTYGKNRSLSIPDSSQLDIKDIIQQLEADVSFLNISKPMKKGSEWLYKPIIVNDTFIDLSRSNTMNLSKQFDGLILIKKISSRPK